MTPGHISTVESSWVDDGFRAHGVSYKGVLMGGLQPNIPEAEKERRRIEIQEEDRLEEMYRNGRLNPQSAVLTISAFPDRMSDSTAKSLGYNPESRKYYLRWHEVDADGNRKTKSLNMHDSNTRLLSNVVTSLDEKKEASPLSSEEILATQIIINKNMIPDLSYVAELIDDMSGGMSFGEKKDNRADYRSLEENSTKREQLAAVEIESFTDQLIELARSDKPAGEILKKYRELTLRTILLIAMDQPEIAKKAVGTAAAEHLRKAKKQIVSGNYGLAMMTINRASSVATPMYMCGMEINSGSTSSSSNEAGLKSFLELFSSKEKTLKCVKCPLKGCGKMVDAKMKISNGKKTISCPACKRSKTYKT